ncbi:MAG: putative rane protein [Acidimicrobiales bacterium]|nr:putative rane protein [Acidimicrobiales bacterium]
MVFPSQGGDEPHPRSGHVGVVMATRSRSPCQEAPPGPTPTLSRMTTSLRRRLVAVAAVSVAAVLLIGEDAREPHGPLPVDQRAMDWLVHRRTGGGVTAARIASHMGDPVALVVLAAVAGVWLWRNRSLGDAGIPVVVLLVASTIEATTKAIIGRPRPPTILHLVPEFDASFPSGHTTGAAALFMAFALVLSPGLKGPNRRSVAVLAAAVLAAMVGAARLILGVHWVTDVVAGWFLGIACAAAIVPAAMDLRSRQTAAGDRHPAPRWRARGGPTRTS